jgi:hypothetical protein
VTVRYAGREGNTLRTVMNLRNKISTEDFRESEAVGISYVNWATYYRKTHWESISTYRRNLNGKGDGINLARYRHVAGFCENDDEPLRRINLKKNCD